MRGVEVEAAERGAWCPLSAALRSVGSCPVALARAAAGGAGTRAERTKALPKRLAGGGQPNLARRLPGTGAGAQDGIRGHHHMLPEMACRALTSP